MHYSPLTRAHKRMGGETRAQLLSRFFVLLPCQALARWKLYFKTTSTQEKPAWLLKLFHEEISPAVHDIICKINASQQAFTKDRSTRQPCCWTRRSLHDGIRAVSIDFRKAFYITVFYLQSSWVWVWVRASGLGQSFLSGRTQQSKLPGVLSKTGVVISGGPHGE